MGKEPSLQQRRSSVPNHEVFPPPMNARKRGLYQLFAGVRVCAVEGQFKDQRGG